LFAEALHYHLEQRQADLVPILHHRASLWYAQHDQPTQAILHAFQTKEWSWTADLIEGQHTALKILTWGINKHKVLLLQDWFLQIPIDLLHARPRLCLACTWLLLFVTPRTVLETRLTAVETLLRAELMTQDTSAMHPAPARQELENLLGETITYRALIQSYDEGGESALALSLQAQALLSADNVGIHGRLAMSKLFASYASCANDARTAVQIGLQGASWCQVADHHDLAICAYEMTASHLIGTGRLHQAQQLTQDVLLLGSKQGAFVLPAGGQPMIWQAEVLREWNQLEVARSLVEEAIQFWEQTESPHSLMFLDIGYEILLRVCLSCGDYHAACSALQEIERIGSSMNHIHLYLRSLFTTVDEVRLWLACGELDRATRWVEELDLKERHGTLFACEREEVACARILLAKQQPVLALQRLEPVLQRATTGQRWGHVIEIRLLQALAFHILSQETQALHALSEAVRLAEPEGYIRSFVDEGIPMQALLSQLREQQHKTGPTPYLNTLLAAFQRESRAQVSTGGPTKTQQLPEPLSERELQVLQLLARGASNQEIAHELVIALDTVKRHVSHIFSKLGANNRVQAIRLARELDLLGEKP
jgi:LuxR family maltose regulon positive regulatory protein